MAIPRRDVKPVAKALIAGFGSLAGVLHAGVDDLAAVDGVSENVDRPSKPCVLQDCG